MIHTWTARCTLVLLALQLASACGETKPPPTPPANTDTTAPSTRASPAGGTYTGGITVSLLCEDEGGSGCGATYYTRDGSEPTRASPSFRDAIALNSNTTLRFFSVDKQGNAEPVKSEVYTFGSTGTDTLAPTTTASPAGGVHAQPVQVTLSCADSGGSGCKATYYTLNGTAPTQASPLYTGALTLSTTTTLRFFSVDASGNAELVHTERYVIDLAAPTTSAKPPGGSYNARQDVTLSCDDGVGTGCVATHYTLDGTTPTRESPRYTAGTVLPLASTTTLKFFSVDAIGNAEPVRTESYVLDTVAPTVSASPKGGGYRTAQSVTLSCSDGTGTGCVGGIWYTLDGSEPTPASALYSAPLSLSANTTLRFLTQDAVGNSASGSEVYVIDTRKPSTSASPRGGDVSGPVSVTLTCDDAGGTGCDGTWYTVDGSTPTTGSTRYTSALPLSSTTTLQFFSMDKLGNVEDTRTETYVFPDPAADTSAQIAAVRASPEGAISLPIDRALVTYVKTKVGTDPAGFFLQAQKNGPALFVAVDPTTLSPSPLPGDRVSLVATQKAATTTTAGQVRVTGLSSFVVHGRGESVTPLLVDASTVDLVSLIPDYESEYLTVSGTLTSTFGNSGAEHQQANLSTVGNPNEPGTSTFLKLRMPSTLLTALVSRHDVNQGCSLTVTAPLWRFGSTAQPSAWMEQDLQVLSCPAPRLLNAVATSATSLTLIFDRALRPASVLASGGQFTFDNGLKATAATVLDREVRLTTSTQVSGTVYTVTVAGTVQDVMGTSVNPTARSKGFIGFKKQAVLRINEVAPNLVSSSGAPIQRDVVELYVVQSGFTDNMSLTTDNFIVASLPPVDVTAGDLIVVHLSPDAATNRDAPGSETASKSEYPSASYASNYDTAWDFHGSSNGFIVYANTVLRVRDSAGNTQDAVAFVQPGNTSVTGFPPLLQALQAEGLWQPLHCNGAPCTYSSFPSALDVSANWGGLFSSTSSRSTTVYRFDNLDSDSRSDWTVGASSLGLPNTNP
jgi:hypothetical protein